MLKATAAMPPFQLVYGDRVEWNGIYPMMVKETESGMQKTMIDPKTVQEVEEKKND